MNDKLTKKRITAFAVDQKFSKKSKNASTVTLSSKRKSHNIQYSMDGHGIHIPSIRKILYAPTYRLFSQIPINLEQLNELLPYIVHRAIDSQAIKKYQSAHQMNRFCQKLANDLQFSVRRFEFDRYRFIALVTVLERANLSLISKMGFIWDAQQDQWASYQYQTENLFINACILGVYWD